MSFSLKDLTQGNRPVNGQYQVKITDVEHGHSQSGTEMATYHGVNADNQKQKFFIKRFKAALWKIGEDLGTLGIEDVQHNPIDDFAGFVEELKGLLVGKILDVSVEDGKPNKDGKVYQEYRILGKARLAAGAFDSV